ncbi:hypothetical protein AWV80_23425 [Cupriavidus sp. UYMU48A]|nr:hypothetical protein AWV80_23425 [Cupriavidus sp. UYMU48A]
MTKSTVPWPCPQSVASQEAIGIFGFHVVLWVNLRNSFSVMHVTPMHEYSCVRRFIVFDHLERIGFHPLANRVNFMAQALDQMFKAGTDIPADSKIMQHSGFGIPIIAFIRLGFVFGLIDETE